MDNLAFTIAPLIAASINAGTPLMLAALGLLVNEKAGVVNLGAEGMMLVSAITGFAVAVNTGSPTLGFLAGAGASMVLSGFFAWLTVWLGTNQYATGLALSLFGAGASTYIGLKYVGNSLQNGRFGIPYLEDIPVLGPALFRQHPMVYLSLLLCLAIAWFCTARGRASCCAPWASRPLPRMRSATPCAVSAWRPCCSAAPAAAWPAPFCRSSTRPCGSKAWWRDGAGSRWR